MKREDEKVKKRLREKKVGINKGKVRIVEEGNKSRG
jgi:hypothetical protein